MVWSLLVWTSALLYVLPGLPWAGPNESFGLLLAYSAPFVLYLNFAMHRRRSWEEFFDQH